MKVFAISDLHLSINNSKPMDIFGPVWSNYIDDIIKDWKQKVTDEDVVLIAGDLSWAMKLQDAIEDINFLSKLPGKKIIIRGNHDYWWEAIGKVRKILPPNFYALQNDSIEIDGVIFCGTRGWSFDDNKLIQRELIRLEMSLNSAKMKQNANQTIICMLHYPPFEKDFANTEFTNLLEKYGVKSVVYGHLHALTKNTYNLVCQKNGITYYLTSCDMVRNKLTQIL